ncbi:hypothetical protein [Rhizobium laguerreae]|uniref:hypothetical protein n=1 Tax=Rhizobium laguerreae TaxID=1076926 RepID=UPI001FE41D26|nr:hypothetical protein [Rhizobium laguerreae]
MTERVIGAYPPSAVLGIPLLFYLRRRVGPPLANCAMVGAFVATFTWMCLVAFFGADEAYAGDHITYQNGMMTWWGLLETVKSLAVTAVSALLLVDCSGWWPPLALKDSPFLKRFQAKCSSRGLSISSNTHHPIIKWRCARLKISPENT